MLILSTAEIISPSLMLFRDYQRRESRQRGDLLMYWPSAAAAAADGDADPAFAGERDHLGDVFWAAAADHRLRPWLAQPRAVARPGMRGSRAARARRIWPGAAHPTRLARRCPADPAARRGFRTRAVRRARSRLLKDDAVPVGVAEDGLRLRVGRPARRSLELHTLGCECLVIRPQIQRVQHEQ